MCKLLRRMLSALFDASTQASCPATPLVALPPPVDPRSQHQEEAGGACEPAQEECCWLCLEGAGELVSVCSCSLRNVHRRCLARWQLERQGTLEETHCRYGGQQEKGRAEFSMSACPVVKSVQCVRVQASTLLPSPREWKPEKEAAATACAVHSR